MSETTVNDTPGWFGKMPSRGDFASRRLPPAFIDGWDAWLQRELVRSRERLGSNWLPAYLVAPVRRFWLGAGALGPTSWVGVWMPSVDSVGRHFPLAIAAPRAAAADGWRAALGNAAWFDAIEAVARQVLDPQHEVDDLERALAGAPSWAGDAGPPQALSELDPKAGLWWCEGASAATQYLCTTALPAGAEFNWLLQPCP